jgi:hypothetical protein
MKKTILLPNNGFGCFLMSLIAILSFVVPLVVVYWLASLVAPIFVSAPVALLAAVLVFVSFVKFK